jgi:Fungal chitosanase of glycosyl hydrolase group 75
LRHDEVNGLAKLMLSSKARGWRMSILGTIVNEGFSCTITAESDGRVHFLADADIDADGANGQHGAPAAYKVDDSGTELLANGGMTIVSGKVICAQPWARDIVILGDDNQPKVFPNGIIASTTWYRYPGKRPNDPAAYVDSETIPYIVVPPLIIQKTAGIVRGCKARVTWQGKSVECVVADKGPSNKIGELSIAAARAIGLAASPRNGGTEKPAVRYELWPGVAAPGFVLQPA